MEHENSSPYSQVPAICPFSFCVIPPLETFLPGEPSGEVVYLWIVLSSEEASRVVNIS